MTDLLLLWCGKHTQLPYLAKYSHNDYSSKDKKKMRTYSFCSTVGVVFNTQGVDGLTNEETCLVCQAYADALSQTLDDPNIPESEVCVIMMPLGQIKVAYISSEVSSFQRLLVYIIYRTLLGQIKVS